MSHVNQGGRGILGDLSVTSQIRVRDPRATGLLTTKHFPGFILLLLLELFALVVQTQQTADDEEQRIPRSSLVEEDFLGTQDPRAIQSIRELGLLVLEMCLWTQSYRRSHFSKKHTPHDNPPTHACQPSSEETLKAACSKRCHCGTHPKMNEGQEDHNRHVLAELAGADIRFDTPTPLN